MVPGSLSRSSLPMLPAKPPSQNIQVLVNSRRGHDSIIEPPIAIEPGPSCLDGKDRKEILRKAHDTVPSETGVFTPFGDDFIPFLPDLPSDSETPITARKKPTHVEQNINEKRRDDGHHEELMPPPPPPRTREWDKGKADVGDTYPRDRGKGKGRESQHSDKYEESRNKTIPGTSRKAPWLADVDWERCRNVATLYV
jgi:hypothetical protein